MYQIVQFWRDAKMHALKIKMFLISVLASLLMFSSSTRGYQMSWENWNENLRNRVNELDKTSTQPHIIFILVDDQGFRDVFYLHIYLFISM